MKNTLLYSAAALMATSAAANAQSIDYQVMGDMFGEPVTTGATGAPQRSTEVPATMIIITQDDISRSPEYDIPGILRHYSGMDVTRFTFAQGEVGIRSAATSLTPRLLVLVNGREVYLDDYGYTAWSTIPVALEEIQQIEVVKGPQSALYGFNAVAGVVNIITRNPAYGNYANATAEVGTNGYQNYRLSAGGALNDHFALRFSYTQAEADEFETLPEITSGRVDPSDNADRETYAVGGNVRFNDKVGLSFEVTQSESEQAAVSSIYGSGRTGYDLNSYQAELGADTGLGFITLTGYKNEYEIGYSFGDVEGELTSLKLQDLFKIGANNTLRLAVEYREANSGSFPDTTGGDLGYESIAFSAMWNHKFSSALELTLAGRYDSVDWSRDGTPNPAIYPFSQEDYDVSIEEFSYNAALVWKPEFGGAMRFSASRGIQAPTMFDMGFLLGSPGSALIGDPNIQPSIVDNLEVAYDRTLSNDVQFRGAVFWQNTDDVKSGLGTVPSILPPAAPVVTYLWGNRGESRTWGVETSLAGSHGEHVTWDVNYTFKQVEDDLPGLGTIHTVDFEGSTPAHLVNGRLGWENGRVQLDGFVNYVSSMDMPSRPSFTNYVSREIDGYVALSARANVDLTDNLGLSFSAQNINFGDGEITNSINENEALYWVSLRASF